MMRCDLCGRDLIAGEASFTFKMGKGRHVGGCPTLDPEMEETPSERRECVG